MTMAMTRRLFLGGTGSLAGSSLVRGGMPALLAATQAACSAKEAGAAFENITPAEAREIVAISSRIFPTTDSPGASEAGVVYFFDKAFGSFLAESRDTARELLAEFEAGIPGRYPGAARLSDLEESEQDDYLKANEDTQFFFMARFLTLAGVFAMSSWGGNRDDIGWKHIGMDGPPHAWAPPFGHYDAEFAQEPRDGE